LNNHFANGEGFTHKPVFSDEVLGLQPYIIQLGFALEHSVPTKYILLAIAQHLSLHLQQPKTPSFLTLVVARSIPNHTSLEWDVAAGDAR
jgi:hypothetical protein